MAAATSSIANFFSFLTSSPHSPSPKYPPPQLSFSSSTASATSSGTKDRVAPLVSSNELPSPLPCSSSSEVMSVVCPCLAFANTMFFQSGYNVQVIVDDNEPEEKLLGRFRREVMRAGVIQECKRRRFFENKQEEKKRKTREAAKRNRRRRPQSRTAPQQRQEVPQNKNGDEDKDNWDLPEGVLPY